jgi:RNA polymerase sigma factor (sigma-70 family)
MLEQAEKHILYPLNNRQQPLISDVLAVERTRLVRLCAYLVGNGDIAEDLAQETLLEAWKNQHKCWNWHDSEGRAKWLLAIARNVCMRCVRHHGRELAHLVVLKSHEEDEDEAAVSIEDVVADDFDVEIELEREELASLLDRALAFLPPTTRAVLIARYIHESPHNADLNTLPHLTLDLPEARKFWSKHPRMQWLHGGEIEHDGQPALICGFQSMTDSERFDAIYQRDTLHVLDTYDSSR